MERTSERTAGDDQPFGFWVRIRDAGSAGDAARMTGLPIFVCGLWILLALLVLILNGLLVADILLGGSAVAVICLASGLAIRMGVFGLVPLCAPLLAFAAFAVMLSALAMLAHLPALDPSPPERVVVDQLFRLTFASLFLLISVSGLRGWWWLRRNRPRGAQ